MSLEDVEEEKTHKGEGHVKMRAETGAAQSQAVLVSMIVKFLQVQV